MSRQQQQPETGIRTGGPFEPYRPIREENFDCRDATSAGGEKYIACGESGSGN